jgi:hypothetical protein
MPRAGEGRSIRIDPEVYEALLTLKRGNMTFSNVIEQMLSDCYDWSDSYPDGQSDLADFAEMFPNNGNVVGNAVTKKNYEN